jgi:hypothetical protein
LEPNPSFCCGECLSSEEFVRNCSRSLLRRLCMDLSGMFSLIAFGRLGSVNLRLSKDGYLRFDLMTFRITSAEGWRMASRFCKTDVARRWTGSIELCLDNISWFCRRCLGRFVRLWSLPKKVLRSSALAVGTVNAISCF